MSSSAEAVLEYLIVKSLAGRQEIVKALYEYFVEGSSPSVLASKYGLSKHQVRGYVQRITEKTGSITKARVLLKYTVPLILRLKPITKNINNSIVICSICNEELPIQIIEDHIRKKHVTVIQESLMSIIEIIKKDMAIGRS